MSVRGGIKIEQRIVRLDIFIPKEWKSLGLFNHFGARLSVTDSGLALMPLPSIGSVHRVRPESDGVIRAYRQRDYCAFAKLTYFLCEPASKYAKNLGDVNFELPGHKILTFRRGKGKKGAED